MKSYKLSRCVQEKIKINIVQLKSRPCENYLVDFCTSAFLTTQKMNLLYSKKSMQMVKLSEEQKSAREFSHSLDFSQKWDKGVVDSSPIVAANSLFIIIAQPCIGWHQLLPSSMRTLPLQDARSSLSCCIGVLVFKNNLFLKSILATLTTVVAN